MDNLKSLSVLFLEDNIEFAKNTVELLEMFFYKIFHASSIKSSLELYKENHIDLIISDIKVDDGNGLDFIRSIRNMNLLIPIIVLSAHKDEDFLLKAIPLNITSYELKPLNYNTFVELLKRISSKFKDVHEIFITNNVIYNFEEKALYFDKINIPLTKKEILFMELMINNMDKLVTEKMIQTQVWGKHKMSEAALKNLIFRLRQKTDKDFIKRVQSIGYKLSSKVSIFT